MYRSIKCHVTYYLLLLNTFYLRTFRPIYHLCFTFPILMRRRNQKTQFLYFCAP